MMHLIFGELGVSVTLSVLQTVLNIIDILIPNSSFFHFLSDGLAGLPCIAVSRNQIEIK